MIGQSRALLAAVDLVGKIARNDAPVLIEGETGTGKELAARAIHYGGPRRASAFIPVNCGAIPDALAENELFGHSKGAYTDAKAEQSGVIAHAERGTLFLDEIDALTPKSQVTLLRFLQDQQYRPLGGGEVRSADVRIIAASNMNLTKLTEQGGFRLDLLFRLMVMHLTMPPLRERNGDVPLLAAHFLRTCTQRYGNGEKHLDQETLDWMENYAWPGNIRELENLVCREYLLADGPIINIQPPAGVQHQLGVDRIDADSAVLDFKRAKTRVIADFEKRYITSVLSAARGNVTRAAMLVGKERRAFGRLLKKHQIDKTTYCAQPDGPAATRRAKSV